MSVKNKVPQIRFLDFSENWVNFNLSEITDVYDGTHQTPAYTKSGVMFLSAENIKTLTSTKFISEEAFKQDFKVHPKKNDVLMTRIGDVGTANVVESDDDKAYYVTLALLKYKQLSPYFLKSSISSPYVQRDIWLRTLHIAFPKKINMNEIKQVVINCPSDSKESDEIGNYFQKLDKLINKHQQKHDKLSSIKKAMLEKMFPKQGETIPEIRFKGFSGEWKESNLAKCTDLLTGNPFNSKEFTSDGIFLVRGMNVKRGYLDTSPNLSAYWPSSKGLERYLLEPEDIVIQMDGALIGKSYAKICTNNLPAILVQRVTRVRCTEVNPEFIYQYIQKNFLLHISGIKTETAVPHLSLHDIRNFSVLLPERLEQIAIGNYFKKLDTLINQHQQQINKLNNIKQACLSKMFV